MPAAPTLLAASLAAAFGSFATLSCVADPLPTGGRVVAGQASISQPTTSTLQVRQGSANAAIDWQSFSVGRDASVVFQQPSTRSIVLNRVVGTDPSQILGRIQANGQVFLVNPYGIVFGRDARVDVAGLVASTANIRNDDFMAGRMRFAIPGQPRASVVNEGQITVHEGGLAALMAPGVANRGTITARLGTVALASGDAFTLDPYGDRLVSWVVPASQLSSVINEGTLSADGGSVQISARAAASVIDGVINLGGTVRARSVGERGGRIVLEGGAGTNLEVAGAIDATGLGIGERGGSVQASGAAIHLTDTALVDASGDGGGGTVLLGAGWHGVGGSGTVVSTAVDRGARIDVSALTSGAGGEAVVWSDGETRFNGRVDARGASRGGQVEVSGHRLAYDGTVDAAAPHGASGTLLLDPGSLLVQSRSAAAPTTGDADVVTTESVNTQLAAGTNVQLTAVQDITVADRIDARLVNSAGTRVNSTGANLALTAGGNLLINSDVILDGGSFTGSAGGKLTQAATGATLATAGGDVSLQAGQGIALQSVQGARNLTLATQRGNIELAAPIGLTGRFVADIMQAQAGDRVHLNGLIARSADAQPAVSINRSAGNTGAAAVQIDDHLIAAGGVSIEGDRATLAAGKAIDTRAASGGSAGSAVAIDAGAGGLALDGNVYTDSAAVTLNSQGNLTQSNASAIATASGAITLKGSGTTTVSRIQTTDALSATGARVVFDAGTTDVAVQAGTLQVNATGSAANAIDVRSSIKLGAGNSTLASASDFMMQPATLIESGATGALTIDAAQNITIENLKSSGAGTLVRSAHGNIAFNQPLGGRPAGDSTTVTTPGGDDVPVPTLYALDARAPEGRIETNGLLLYGLKGAPLTLDMPAPGLLAYGLNLAASEVYVRGLVFVFDGAISIQGTTRLVVGNSIRSVGSVRSDGSVVGGYPMAIGGGEIDLYRPTHPDGTPYQNTDVIVAQYSDGTLKFFEKLNGVWQTSTSFVSVVMPADLPLPPPTTAQPDTLPGYWINRLASDPRASQVSAADFAANGVTPVRLVSLPNVLLDKNPDHTVAFTNNQGLDSYDASGRNPFVALTYDSIVGNPNFAGTEVQALTTTNGVPGTRFVPKILITNDPGPKFPLPGMVPVPNVVNVFTTNVGRIRLSGNVYETDAQGHRLVAGINGGNDSEGDLRNVAFKVVTFDTQSVFQDSRVVLTRGIGNPPPGECTLAPGTCLDDPTYPIGILGQPSPQPFNDYSRIVYAGSSTSSRGGPFVSGSPHTNPISAGFQASGYLSMNCSGGACERPQAPTDTTLRPAYYFAGEQGKPGANPNALSSSLSWVGPQANSAFQPGANSFGRYEFFIGGPGGATSSPSLAPSRNDTYVKGLSSTAHSGEAANAKMNVSVTQAAALATFDAPTPTRTVLAMNFGILSGQGVGVGVDTSNAFKSTLPGASVAGTDGQGPLTFSTITPTILSVSGGASGLQIASALPPTQVSVPVQLPIDVPRPSGGNPPTGSTPSTPDTVAGTTDASGTLHGLLSQGAANAEATGDGTVPEAAAFLILGGRGLAQSVDLGRSGGLGSSGPVSTRFAYEVACTLDAPAPGERPEKRPPARRDTGLPQCP